MDYQSSPASQPLRTPKRRRLVSLALVRRGTLLAPVVSDAFQPTTPLVDCIVLESARSRCSREWWLKSTDAQFHTLHFYCKVLRPILPRNVDVFFGDIGDLN